MQQKFWLTWNDNQTPPWAYPIVWNSNSYAWNEVAVFIEIAQEVIPSGGGGLGQVIFQQRGLSSHHIDYLKKKHGEEKVETFIKVVCKVNNLNYEERKNRKTKPIITIKEVTRAFEKVSSVKVVLVDKDI